MHHGCNIQFTFIHISFSDHVDTLFELIAKLQKVVAANIGLCHHCEDFHISLSKTFVLKYHLISPFSTSLQKTVSGLDRCVYLSLIIFKLKYVDVICNTK